MRQPRRPRPSLLRLASVLCGGLLAGLGGGAHTLHAGWDEFADAAENALTRVSADEKRSLQISGRIDLATYYVPEPVADLRYTDADEEVLFEPVLRLFADARLAPGIQAHAQLRSDRGFDPADQSLELRLEEAYVHFAPWPERRVGLRVGRFATVFGNWARRRHAWDYPFITAPLAQENLTGLWDGAAATSATALRRWAHVAPVGDAAALTSDERKRIPVMWGAVYGTGAALSLGGPRWDLAIELKNAGLSSRPGTWNDCDAEVWETPASAARLGWRPSAPWDLGLSFSRGIYLQPEPVSVASGHDRDDYAQTSLGHDLTYARGHFQFWGELIASRFEVPTLGHADTLAYALEAKYRFTPRWAGFVRWSQQFFEPVDLPGGDEARWGREAWRIEAGPVLRLAAHAQLKLQAGVLHERPSTEDLVPSAAAQLSLRF